MANVSLPESVALKPGQWYDACDGRLFSNGFKYQLQWIIHVKFVIINTVSSRLVAVLPLSVVVQHRPACPCQLRWLSMRDCDLLPANPTRADLMPPACLIPQGRLLDCETAAHWKHCFSMLQFISGLYENVCTMKSVKKSVSTAGKLLW